MRAAWLNEPKNVVVRDLPDPEIESSRDAVVAVRYSGICGSDLWGYRGLINKQGGASTGHEFIGEVTAVGREVTSLRAGDLVIAPFMYSEGACEMCSSGMQPLCAYGGLWGRDGAGAQAEQIRVPFAEATLVKLPWAPGELDADLARKLLPATDVFATGTHGAVLAEIDAGDTVVVVGDGAVGISAAVAAQQRSAERVIVIGENAARLATAQNFGVETLQGRRGDSPIDDLLKLTQGQRPDRVIECVGLEASFDTALELVKPGGRVSFVGVPHGVPAVQPQRIFAKQITLVGGVAPARHYLPEVLDLIRAGTLDLSPLIDAEFGLSEVALAYDAMDTGRVLKAMLDMSR